MRSTIPSPSAAVPASLLLAALACSAHAATITYIPAPVWPDFPQPVYMSLDGRVVFGVRSIQGAIGNSTSQPWRWSAQAGYIEPPLPAGTNTGTWQSWTGAGDIAIMTGRTPTATGWTYSRMLVDAAGVTHPLISPIAGYTPQSFSGDGQSMLLARDDQVNSGLNNNIAIVGPAGTRYVESIAGWNTQATGLSCDGTVLAGFTWPQGSSSNTDSRLVRWTSGQTYGSPVPGYGPPAGWRIISGAIPSYDGTLLSGIMQDGAFAYHTFLFSEAGGFETLAGIPSDIPYIPSINTPDNSLAFISGPAGLETYVWRRGVGTMTTMQYLAQNGVDVSLISGAFFFQMSSDGNTFIGESGSGGVLVPILVTIPAPGAATLVPIGAFALARSRRTARPAQSAS